MEQDYGTEVKLLAVTRFDDEFREEIYAGEGYRIEGEDLIEYAGRLCYNVENKTGSGLGWIQDRIKDGHESILEHASATFQIKCSRVVTHELVRHRVASYSQRSQRYVNESEPRYITPPELEEVKLSWIPASEWFKIVMGQAWQAYGTLLKAGVPKEIARYVLPNACETQIVVTMNFRELRHFIKLRTGPRSLPEMREVANKIRGICKEIAPEVFADV